MDPLEPELSHSILRKFHPFVIFLTKLDHDDDYVLKILAKSKWTQEEFVKKITEYEINQINSDLSSAEDAIKYFELCEQGMRSPPPFSVSLSMELNLDPQNNAQMILTTTRNTEFGVKYLFHYYNFFLLFFADSPRTKHLTLVKYQAPDENMLIKWVTSLQRMTETAVLPEYHGDFLLNPAICHEQLILSNNNTLVKKKFSAPDQWDCML
jgi:hypothetical protein